MINKAFCLLLIFLAILFKPAFSQSYNINDRTRVYSERLSNDSMLLKVDNSLVIPVTLRLQLDLENLKPEKDSFIVAIIPPGSIGTTVAVLRPTVPGLPFKCSYTWRFALGDSSKTPDFNYPYSLPHLKHKDYKITQGPNGKFSHHDMFAYDFDMPTGTHICAARDGLIALVKSDSDKGGPNKKYIDNANFVSVYHADGTIANYYHLRKDGITVKEGQFVKQGEIIGYSGNTGFSDGAHLHFEVTQTNVNSENKKWLAFKWESPENDPMITMNTTEVK